MTRLPKPLLAKLVFKEPDYLVKGGAKWRGRILQQRTNNIFDATWCFYEVGVGHYSAGGGAGGIGLVCFPENKKCGNGIHTAAVTDLVTHYASSHPGFNASSRGSRSQYVFKYISVMQSVEKPADILSELKTATLPQLEMLTVAK